MNNKKQVSRFFSAAAGAALLMGVNASGASAQSRAPTPLNSGNFFVPTATPTQVQNATQRLGQFLDTYFDFSSGTSSTLEAIVQAANETGNNREATMLQVKLNQIHPIAIHKLPPAQQASMAERVLNAIVQNTAATKAGLGTSHADLKLVFAAMDREAQAWNAVMHPAAIVAIRPGIANIAPSQAGQPRPFINPVVPPAGILPPPAKPFRP